MVLMWWFNLLSYFRLVGNCYLCLWQAVLLQQDMFGALLFPLSWKCFKRQVKTSAAMLKNHLLCLFNVTTLTLQPSCRYQNLHQNCTTTVKCDSCPPVARNNIIFIYSNICRRHARPGFPITLSASRNKVGGNVPRAAILSRAWM